MITVLAKYERISVFHTMVPFFLKRYKGVFRFTQSGDYCLRHDKKSHSNNGEVVQGQKTPRIWSSWERAEREGTRNNWLFFDGIMARRAGKPTSSEGNFPVPLEFLLCFPTKFGYTGRIRDSGVTRPGKGFFFSKNGGFLARTLINPTRAGITGKTSWIARGPLREVISRSRLPRIFLRDLTGFPQERGFKEGSIPWETIKGV